jgi:TRAP-type uncharacterized transport system fused permease subunit
MIFGAILILLTLEAVRRTSGWVMPLVVTTFLVYALVGPRLPAPWTHTAATTWSGWWGTYT